MIGKFIVSLGLAVALAGATPALAQQNKQDQEFLTKAIEGNYAEVEMGKLAQQKGQSQEVKSFGQMLTSDHQQANQKAIEVAKQMGITPPTGPNAKQKADHAKMEKMSGDQFDKMFAKDMVTDHKKDIKEYEQAAKSNSAAGSYAKESLPVLNKHLQSAQSLENRSANR